MAALRGGAGGAKRGPKANDAGVAREIGSRCGELESRRHTCEASTAARRGLCVLVHSSPAISCWPESTAHIMMSVKVTAAQTARAREARGSGEE